MRPYRSLFSDDPAGKSEGARRAADMLRALQNLSGVLLIAVGGFFTVLGLHDLVLASRSQERLIGGALAVVGIASLVGVGLLIRDRRGWGAWSLASVGALGGVTLFAVQASFRSDGRN